MSVELLDVEVNEETGEILDSTEVGEISEELINQIASGQAEMDDDGIIHVKEPENLNRYTGLAYEEACELLRNLNDRKDFVAWTAGDIIVGMTEDIKKKDALREMIGRIALDTNSDPDTVTQYRWISKKFPPGPIRDDYAVLTWSHYRSLAAVEDPIPWLEKCANEQMSVNQLMSELAVARENKRIQQSGGCSRKGCRNNVSTGPSERVSMQVYGKKFAFCSAACGANVLLNDLHTIKAGILGEVAPPESEKSILVSHPDKNLRDTMAEEDWFSERHEKEMGHFKGRYAKIAKK